MGMGLERDGAKAPPVSDGGAFYAPIRGVNADGEPFTSADQSGAAVPCTRAPTDTQQRLVIDDLVVSVGAAISVTFTEETSGKKVHGPIPMSANSTLTLTTRGKIILASANTRLMVQTSGAGVVTVQSNCHQEP